MSITVTGRKMPVTDALREYAEEKIGNSMRSTFWVTTSSPTPTATAAW